MQRVRIFIDFWNLQIGWNQVYPDRPPIPWQQLPLVLASEAAQAAGATPGRHSGTWVYASVDATSSKDRKLRGFLDHTLSSFPGYTVQVRERKPRGTIRCKEDDCGAAVDKCPACKKPLRATSEKGVDAAIITDLMSMAVDNNYDIGVLVSGDADYVPAVKYIQQKTDKRIVQAYFKAHGDSLRTACWSHLFFEELRSKFPPGAASN